MRVHEIGKLRARILPGRELRRWRHVIEQFADRLRQIRPTDQGPRLKRVIRKRLHHAGAGDGHDPGFGPVAPDVGHDAGIARTHRLQLRTQPHADERREVGARDLRGRANRAIRVGQPSQRVTGEERGTAGVHHRARFDGQRPAVGGEGALAVAGRFEQLAELGKRRRVTGVQRHRLSETGEGRATVAQLPLDRAELTVEKCAVRRADDCLLVRAGRFVQLVRTREIARRRQLALGAPESQHFDAAPDVAERRIGANRGVERGDRLRLAVERQQRFAAPDERGGVHRAGPERAVEMRERRFRILAREVEVPGGCFSRIKRGRQTQRRRELAIGVSEIVGLQEPPASIRTRRGKVARECLGDRGLLELRELGSHDDRGRHQPRGAGLRRQRYQGRQGHARHGHGRPAGARNGRRLSHGKSLAQKTSEAAPRHVGFDRHAAVPGLVEHDPRVAVESRDQLPIGGVVRVERQRDAPHVERESRVTVSTSSPTPSRRSAEMQSADGSASWSRRRSSAVSSSHLL